MKPSITFNCFLVAAVATLAFAADPNVPTIISPTSTPYPLANGIAPNGITASIGGIFFTQPFADPLQPRGAYSITTGGAVSLVGSVFTSGVNAENGIAIATGTGSGFTVGDIYVTAPS